MGHRGRLRYIYIASARDEGCDYGNHYPFSFGLDDRYEKSLGGQSAIRLYRNLSP